jgi:glycosyltransferase involved in cell wall biosynthesis
VKGRGIREESAVGKVQRVAYIVVMFPCYSETFVLREIRELMRRGVEVTVISLRGFSERIMDEDARSVLPHTWYSPYLFSLGLLRSTIYYMVKRPGAYAGIIGLLLAELYSNPRELLKNAALLPKSVYFARRCTQGKIQHIHAHFANYPATAAYIISRLTGIPYTMTAHAHDIFQNQLLLPAKLSRAEKLFAISEYNRQFIIKNCPGVTPEKIEVLHCGLDASPRTRASGGGVDPRMILSVGRLVAIKGFDTLVKAVAILRDEGYGVRCAIAGDGPERRRIEELVERRNLRGAVELVGERTSQEVFELMGRCAIFVLPSRPAGRKSGVMDGIPVSLMEAMSLGIPVVSCPVSGIPELVVNEETGLLVPPDDERMLAEAIARLIDDEELRRRLGHAGRERVAREFTIAGTVDRLMEVFGSRGEGA